MGGDLRSRREKAVPTYTTKGRVRREAIVDAAAALAVEGGLTALSHRTVADRAGVPLGSMTYYFSGVDELRAAALAAVSEREAERARAALGGTRPRSRRAVARLVLDVVVGLDRLDTPAAVAAAYERFLEAARYDGAVDATRAWQDTFVDLTGEALAGTDLEALDPRLVLALVDGTVVDWLMNGDHRPDDLVKALAGHLGRVTG